MLRRLHREQPSHFAFTPANLAWAQGQITKYPEGRQASAIIPLLWRAQEQEGWLSRPAIEHVAAMLGMPYIRALEVATFYFMFQLAPVGSVAHVQVCGTTSCMIMGAEDLVAVCKRRISPAAHTPSADGRFSWEEVECMGACANAPMAQIGKDYYEDLTPEILESLLDRFAAGEVPVPGPQNGRYASEPKGGLTSLTQYAEGRPAQNASAALAVEIGETVKRIDGTEVPLRTPWVRAEEATPADGPQMEPVPGAGRPADSTGATVQEAAAHAKGRPEAQGNAASATPAGTPHAKAQPEDVATAAAPAAAPPAAAPPAAAPADAVATHAATPQVRPAALAAARDGQPDDLKIIIGIGPKLEALCHRLGFFHFDQIAAWTPEEIAWVDNHLEGFKGRVTRDDWVGQARRLAARG